MELPSGGGRMGGAASSSGVQALRTSATRTRVCASWVSAPGFIRGLSVRRAVYERNVRSPGPSLRENA
jgi:hypothetical protein